MLIIKLYIMTSFIFRSMDRREQNGRWYVCKVSLRAGILFLVEEDSFLVSADCAAHFPLQYLLPVLLFFLFSEPPEAYIDNEHDEKNAAGCQLGIGGAGVQILGVTPVLL